MSKLQQLPKEWYAYAKSLDSGTDYTQGQKHATNDCADALDAAIKKEVLPLVETVIELLGEFDRLEATGAPVIPSIGGVDRLRAALAPFQKEK